MIRAASANGHDDLKKVVEKSGPWDVVIFSGDIAQAGSAQDFEAATSALRELWADELT